MADFIYPRDFFQAQAEEKETGLCFVLMPFADEYHEVYDGVIKPTLEQRGMACKRADDIYSPRPILITVMEQISKAELVIAELSGRNPNVFYEVGLAHLMKPNEAVVLLSRTMDDVPFDLRHLRLIIYENSSDGFQRLKTELEKTLQGLGLAQAHEEPTAASSGEPMVDQPEPSGAPLLEGDWTSATLIFPNARAGYDKLLGGVAAGLLHWMDYESIERSHLTIHFPNGKITYLGEAGVQLEVSRDQRVPLDELAKIIPSGYEVVEYQLDETFEAGPLSKHLKSVELPITYVSDSLVTVAVDQRGSGFIDIAAAGDGATVKLRASEGETYQTGSGVVPLDEIIEYLTGKVGREQFAQALSKYRYGL